MRAHEFIRDHVTFKLPYDYSYHMKTPINLNRNSNFTKNTELDSFTLWLKSKWSYSLKYENNIIGTFHTLTESNKEERVSAFTYENAQESRNCMGIPKNNSFWKKIYFLCFFGCTGILKMHGNPENAQESWNCMGIPKK